MNIYKKVLENNRIWRLDYFLLGIFNNLILILFIIIFASLNLLETGFAIFFLICLFFIWSFFGITALIKRFHDIDMSWWCCLYCLIPFIGYFVPLILLFVPWTPWENRFWPSPEDLKNLEKENPNNLEYNFEKIKELFEKGLISEEEYEAKKKKILDL